MDRRALLELGSFATIACAFPSLARAFEQEPQPFDRDAALLDRAMASARLVGKPVLAIVVPRDKLERIYRGSLWGALLQLASEEMLATFALVEVVCVRADVARPFGAQPDDEPYAFLIEQSSGTMLTPIRAQIGECPLLKRGWDATAAVHAKWAEPLGLAVYRAIASDPARIAELALRARAALDRLTLHEVDRDVRDSSFVPSARIERAAALYYAASNRESGARNWFPALADVAEARLRLRAPPGVQWRDEEPVAGCGIGPCGTGYAPWPSRRFLEFLTGA